MRQVIFAALVSFGLFAVVLGGGCSGGGGGGGDGESGGSSSSLSGSKTPPDGLITDASGIASALSDTSRANLGVWSLLNALGIGVYTPSGGHVMDGSETGESDFWLYDFQVPLLVKMISQPSYPFSDYYSLMAAMGYQGSKDQLLAAYRDTYSANAGAFLPSLFSAMGLVFEGDPSITPLQEWLLMLDGLVPANPSQAARQTTGSSKLSTARTPCDDILSGVKKNPLWGLVNTARSFNFSKPIDPKDIINAALMHLGVETTLSASAIETHEGHDGKKGNPVKFTATARFVFDFPDELIKCGAKAGVTLPKDGPIDGMRIDWTIPSSLSPEHGTISVPSGSGGTHITYTKSDGKTWTEFTPKTEAADGEGAVNWEFKTVTATYNIQQALENFFSFGAMLMEIFSRRSESVDMTIKWHSAGGYYFTWGGGYLSGINDSGKVYTCNYPEGPWIGVADLIGTASMGPAIILFDMTGNFEFTFPPQPSDGKYITEISYPLSGIMEVSAAGETVTCNVTYDKTFAFTLNSQTHNVRMTERPTNGSLSCMGASVPISGSGEQDILMPLKAYEDCPQ